MAKTLCDWSKKDISDEFDRLCRITTSPEFVCRKCARCACAARHLCKPKRLENRQATAAATPSLLTPAASW
ncbi:MAG: hypothetical protein KDK99_13475 [Verrucomicrobiales bacterium]|nr:hypothetical protein [Verrucomicrobiales bacterium]